MILIKEISTGEVQGVENYSEDAYPTSEFEVVGEVPEGMDPTNAVAGEEGVVENIERCKQKKHAEIEARLAQAFLAGYLVPAGTALAGTRLQLRNETDRSNWISSAIAYKEAIEKGHGSVQQAIFRGENNENIALTFSEGYKTLIDMQAWGTGLVGCSWRLKDLLQEAETIEEINAIDVNDEDWPEENT